MKKPLSKSNRYIINENERILKSSFESPILESPELKESLREIKEKLSQELQKNNEQV